MTIMQTLEQLKQELSRAGAWYVYKLSGSYNAFSKEETTVRWLIEIVFYNKTYNIVYVPAFQGINLSMQLLIKDRTDIPSDSTYTTKKTINHQFYMKHNDEYMGKIKDILFTLEDISNRPLDPELWNALDNE